MTKFCCLFPAYNSFFLLVFQLIMAEKSTNNWWDRYFRVINYRPPPSAAWLLRGGSRSQVWTTTPCGVFDSFFIFLTPSNRLTRHVALSSSKLGGVKPDQPPPHCVLTFPHHSGISCSILRDNFLFFLSLSPPVWHRGKGGPIGCTYTLFRPNPC